MDENIHYESVRFYIVESAKIKKQLTLYQTEYFPEKVRELITSYKFTISKAIEHGKLYLDNNDGDEYKIEKVRDIIARYKQLLDSFKKDE